MLSSSSSSFRSLSSTWPLSRRSRHAAPCYKSLGLFLDTRQWRKPFAFPSRKYIWDAGYGQIANQIAVPNHKSSAYNISIFKISCHILKFRSFSPSHVSNLHVTILIKFENLCFVNDATAGKKQIRQLVLTPCQRSKICRWCDSYCRHVCDMSHVLVLYQNGAS